MSIEIIVLIFLSFFLIAVLYSSVGHAGASGYMAIMSLLSFSTQSIKSTSLLLNILVAAITSYKFIKQGLFDRRIFFSCILTSIPMAYFGGGINISPHYFKLFAGGFLVFSSFMLLYRQFLRQKPNTQRFFPLRGGLILGAVIGFFSGLIGVGGGIFLTPILVFFNWTDIKNASGISALFIFFNSIAGLLGHIDLVQHFDSHIYLWMLAVILGGFLGSYLGTIKLNKKVITYFLVIVLFSAGLKIIWVEL